MNCFCKSRLLTFGIPTVASLMLFAQLPAKASVIFSDTEFQNSDWVAQKLGDNTPGMTGTFSASQSVGTGNPAPSRFVNLTFTADGTSSQGMSVWHNRPTDVYDPSTQGAISSVDVTIAGQGDHSMQPVILQGGFFYEAVPTTFPNTPTFTSHFASGLVATDFTRVLCAVCPFNPDFSGAGGAIIFGITTAGSTLGAGTAFRQGFIDNWGVTIRQAAVTGSLEPGTLALLSLGLFVLFVKARHLT